MFPAAKEFAHMGRIYEVFPVIKFSGVYVTGTFLVDNLGVEVSFKSFHFHMSSPIGFYGSCPAMFLETATGPSQIVSLC
jgi:hypothetical protein